MACVTHAGRTYHRGALVSTALWHLLKRIYVDQDWPADTTLDQLNTDARATIQAEDTEIWCNMSTTEQFERLLRKYYGYCRVSAICCGSSKGDGLTRDRQPLQLKAWQQ